VICEFDLLKYSSTYECLLANGNGATVTRIWERVRGMGNATFLKIGTKSVDHLELF